MKCFSSSIQRNTLTIRQVLLLLYFSYFHYFVPNLQVPNRTNEWVQEQVPIWTRLYLVIGQGLFLPLLVL